jgi:hypothetical protein
MTDPISTREGMPKFEAIPVMLCGANNDVPVRSLETPE